MTSITFTLRGLLIRLLAGRSLVILNARIKGKVFVQSQDCIICDNFLGLKENSRYVITNRFKYKEV